MLLQTRTSPGHAVSTPTVNTVPCDEQGSTEVARNEKAVLTSWMALLVGNHAPVAGIGFGGVVVDLFASHGKGGA